MKTLNGLEINMKYNVRELIDSLQKTENQEQEVCISIDDGETIYPINLIGRINGKFVLQFSEEFIKR
jgi:hypothetical protein